MVKRRHRSRKVRASRCAKLVRVKCVRTKNCKMSHGKKRRFCRVKTNRKRQNGGSRRRSRRSAADAVDAADSRRRRSRRSRRGGLGLASAVSTAVLPFGLLWAQRAYKGKKGKSLRKMYRS